MHAVFNTTGFYNKLILNTIMIIVSLSSCTMSYIRDCKFECNTWYLAVNMSLLLMIQVHCIDECPTRPKQLESGCS